MTEALTNITRHANAHQVSLMTRCSASQLTLDIRDDGIGFDPTIIEKQVGHYGLLGIRERCRLIGAQFTIISAPGSGTLLRLQIPLHQEGLTTCKNVSASLSPMTT
ncbi:MAG: hypothetical protein J2P36_10030 [Ktedonobacteraceae bacterium]|nr:hypothetical protein [Ktedonobacteraceae bacterium]